jgi:hypothetical protein
MKEAIRIRAEEIYIRNGRIPGRDLDNWTQAETEILRELGSLERRRGYRRSLRGREDVPQASKRKRVGNDHRAQNRLMLPVAFL